MTLPVSGNHYWNVMTYDNNIEHASECAYSLKAFAILTWMLAHETSK